MLVSPSLLSNLIPSSHEKRKTNQPSLCIHTNYSVILWGRTHLPSSPTSQPLSSHHHPSHPFLFVSLPLHSLSPPRIPPFEPLFLHISPLYVCSHHVPLLSWPPFISPSSRDLPSYISPLETSLHIFLPSRPPMLQHITPPHTPAHITQSHTSSVLCFTSAMALNLQTTDHIKSKGWCNILVKRYIMVVSFPGSPALERKHWSWVGGESLVFLSREQR